MDTGLGSVPHSTVHAGNSCRRLGSSHGSFRRRDSSPDRRRTHPDRPVRPGAPPALEPRRARRPPVSRLSQFSVPVHRREIGAGRADGARRGERRCPVHPAPGRVRARLDARARELARRPRGTAGGKVEPRPTRLADPLHCRIHRPGLGRSRDARALQRGEPADHDLSRDEDRSAVVRADVGAGGDAVWLGVLGSKYQGQRGPTPSRYWKNFE